MKIHLSFWVTSFASFASGMRTPASSNRFLSRDQLLRRHLEDFDWDAWWDEFTEGLDDEYFKFEGNYCDESPCITYNCDLSTGDCTYCVFEVEGHANDELCFTENCAHTDAGYTCQCMEATFNGEACLYCASCLTDDDFGESMDIQCNGMDASFLTDGGLGTCSAASSSSSKSSSASTSPNPTKVLVPLAIGAAVVVAAALWYGLRKKKSEKESDDGFHLVDDGGAGGNDKLHQAVAA